MRWSLTEHLLCATDYVRTQEYCSHKNRHNAHGVSSLVKVANTTEFKIVLWSTCVKRKIHGTRKTVNWEWSQEEVRKDSLSAGILGMMSISQDRKK